MNTRLFLAILLLPIFAGAQNLVFNGNFKMGTAGYAQQRALRFDTNPKQHYIPIETVKLPDGSHALKITSPYTESSTISTRQFSLKNKTKYTMRVKMRSTVPTAVSIMIYSMTNNWHQFRSRYQIGSEWKEFVFHFNTGSKNVKGYFYHVDFSMKFKGELFIRDLEVFESSSNAANGIQFAADVKEPVLETTEKKLEWSVPVYAWNGTEKPFKGNVTVTAQEQFFKEKSHKAELPVELAPGECKVFPVKFTTDYGCFVITEKCSEASRCVPAYQGVIGKYTAKKLDFEKDFCIGLNGGPGIIKTAASPERSTVVWNAGSEKILEFYSKAGCRLLRDFDFGHASTGWALMEEKEGEWDFTHCDYVLDLYKKYNIEPLACVGGEGCLQHKSTHQNWRSLTFPKWIRDASTPVKPAKYNWSWVGGNSAVPPLDKWKRYVSKLTAHAKGRIKYYEVLNEPNGYLPAEIYFPYLKAFYEEAKKSDPSCKIIGLCVTSDFGTVGDQFTTDMMKLGAGKYMDIVSFHPYGGRELNSINPADKYIANFRKCLGPEYEKTMPIWNSELFFLYDHDPNIRHSEYEVNPARLMARTMVDLGEGVRQATSLFFHQLIQRQLFPEGWYNRSSLRQILPNSTYVAYNATARFLEAAKPVAKFKLDSGMIAYIFRKDGKLLAGLWNYQHKKDVKADLSMFDMYDVHGNSIPAAKDMPVTDIPYYLKQGKLSDEAFIDAVKNLKIELGTPVEAQPHARVIDFEGKKILYATLVNESGKDQSIIAGFSGNGLTAVKNINTEIPAREIRVIAIPLREAASQKKDPEVQLFINGTLIRSKLQLHNGLMIPAGTSVKLEKDDFNAVWSITKKGNDVVLNFKVADKTDSGESAGRKMWEQDCLELFFDNDPLELIGLNGRHYTPQTFRLFILPRLDKEKQLVAWLDPKSPFKTTDFKHAVKVSPDGYEAEITIPAEKVSGMIGLDVRVSDSLPGKKAHRTAAWSSQDKGYIYRSAFNLIKF